MLQLVLTTVMMIDATVLEIHMTKRNGSTFLDFILFSTILFSEFENKLLKALENDSSSIRSLCLNLSLNLKMRF